MQLGQRHPMHGERGAQKFIEAHKPTFVRISALVTLKWAVAPSSRVVANGYGRKWCNSAVTIENCGEIEPECARKGKRTHLYSRNLSVVNLIFQTISGLSLCEPFDEPPSVAALDRGTGWVLCTRGMEKRLKPLNGLDWLKSRLATRKKFWENWEQFLWMNTQNALRWPKLSEDPPLEVEQEWSWWLDLKLHELGFVLGFSESRLREGSNDKSNIKVFQCYFYVHPQASVGFRRSSTRYRKPNRILLVARHLLLPATLHAYLITKWQTHIKGARLADGNSEYISQVRVKGSFGIQDGNYMDAGGGVTVPEEDASGVAGAAGGSSLLKTILSINFHSLASSADSHVSRSRSRSIFSTGWPVCLT